MHRAKGKTSAGAYACTWCWPETPGGAAPESLPQLYAHLRPAVRGGVAAAADPCVHSQQVMLPIQRLTLVRPQRHHPPPAALRRAHRLRVAARRRAPRSRGRRPSAGRRGDDRDGVGRALGDRGRSRARHRAARLQRLLGPDAVLKIGSPDRPRGSGDRTHSTLEFNRRFEQPSGDGESTARMFPLRDHPDPVPAESARQAVIL